jgi:pimeloyl-ACP methyl ester carboxylesterase
MRTTAMIEINGPTGSTKSQWQRKLGSLMAASAWSVMALLTANPSEAADDSVFKTKDVILVHGAWADGSSWSKVIPLLQRKGFHVTAVKLPLTSVAEDVATLNRAIELDPGPLLLVGHSYAGIVITEAGNDPKVSGLIYQTSNLDPQEQARELILGKRTAGFVAGRRVALDAKTKVLAVVPARGKHSESDAQELARRMILGIRA